MGGKRNYLFGQPTINPLEQKAFRLSGYRAGLRIYLLSVVMSAELKEKNIFWKIFPKFSVLGKNWETKSKSSLHNFYVSHLQPEALWCTVIPS